MKSARTVMSSVFALVASVVFYAAPAHAAEVVCTVDNEPVTFVPVEGSTIGITNRIARISDEVSLSYHYNLHYGIGGSILLKVSGERDRLLIRWDSENEFDYNAGPVRVNGQIIWCR